MRRGGGVTAVVATSALAALAIVLIAPFGGSAHHLRAQFTSVEQVVPGLDVRIAGRRVGKTGAVDLARGGPIVRLNIDESDVWPLPAGTTAEIRWGSTTSLAYRYIELHPGPLSGPRLPGDALLTESHTVTPVELDQAYRIFRGRTSGDLAAVVGEVRGTLAANGPALSSALSSAPSALDATSAVLGRLGAEQRALDTLVREGEQVTSAVGARRADLGSLVEHLAGTFDEFAAHRQAEQAALQAAPQTLQTATGTLKRLDRSLAGLQSLVDDVAPGAVQLRALAPTAHDALLELFHTGPLATSALRRGTLAAPAVSGLLTTGTPFLPRLTDVLSGLDPMMSCIRPYVPELAGTLSTWAGFNDNYDAQGHYARTFPLLFNPLLVSGTPQTSAQIVGALEGRLTYAMPRPPGLNAGQPWLLPQCGAGPQSLDPSADPERTGP
jgi:virulence factor Mce-like protein